MAENLNGDGLNGNGFNEAEKFYKGDIKPELEQSLMKIERYFGREGKDVFDFDIDGKRIEWVKEDVNVTDDMGKVIFTQKDVERPIFWSALAIKVVANKYFWGDQLKGERENSIRQLVGRVSKFIGRQALKQGYFDENQSNILRDEFAAICLNQLCSFNSPVWFNVGIQEYNPNAGGVSAYVWDNFAKKAVKSEKKSDRPQCSACFIQSVEDNMESIMAVQAAEANLFKAGSGTGTNRSNLRSSRERLTGGGRASGPVSFMRGYDVYAGVIKSGGKTRRAAKMEILNVEHPDIMDFINAKQNEEKKAWALIEQGYGGGMNGEAYSSVLFQNCNMSVRAPDEFMLAVKNNSEWKTKFVKNGETCETYKAKEIMNKIAEGTWTCGDPGIQCDTIINKYHTCKNSGRINASNPCVTGDTRVLVEGGRWIRIDALLDKETDILTNTGVINRSRINGSFKTGRKPVYLLKTKSGYEIKLTGDHKVFTVNRGFVPSCELTKEDYILLPNYPVSQIEEPKDKTFYQMLGVYLGDGGSGKLTPRNIILTMNKEEEKPILEKFAQYVATNYTRITHKNCPAQVCMAPTACRYNITNTSLLKKFSDIIELNLASHEKRISEKMFNLPLGAQKYVLQGLFTSDGTVANYGEKSQYVALDSASLQLLKEAQLLLLGFGIKSKIYTNRRAGKLKSFLPDGKGGLKEYNVKEMNSLHISRSSRIKFEKLIGFMPESKKSERLRMLNEQRGTYSDLPIDAVRSLEYKGEEEVYDLTEPLTHTFVANGVTIHNCSEYLFLDDSACNLASINLMRFRTANGGFNIEKFKKVIRTFIIGMDLIVDWGSYPTEKIAENSHFFRPLGLGYANLGALLMSLGLPYDSEEGRAVAAAISAVMCGEAYKTSGELAKLIGPFHEFAKNRESMLNVIKMQREHVKEIDVEKIPADLRDLVNVAWDCWSEALELGKLYGFRNAQTTVLAPTGCLTENSLISTDKGLVRLTSFGNKKGDKWQDVSFKVMTDEGPKEATKFYINGEAQTRKIRTASGYEIQGTEKHQIKVLDPETNNWIWKKFSEIKENDIVPLAINTIFGDEKEVLLPLKPELHWNADFELKTPVKMDEELAEVIGYFMGDGSLHSKGLRFCVDNKDEDVVERLRRLVKNLFNLNVKITQQERYKEVAVNSVPLTMWWDASGFAKLKPTEGHKGKGYTPRIPDAILHTNNRKIYSAFLRGLFEADGTVSMGVPSFSSGSKSFTQEIKTLLLALGYPTITKIDKSGWGEGELYVSRLKNVAYNKEFLDKIGFLSSRKTNEVSLVRSLQSGKNDYIYLSKELVDETAPVGSIHRDAVLLSLRRYQAIPREKVFQLYRDTKNPQLLWTLQFFYDRVDSNIDGGIQPTYDLSVPENVTYTANGFISHNTIAFMLDCDTTGIEPDIALVKYKVLSGGGMLKIINRSVSLALQRLNYGAGEIKEIIDYIDKNDTIEGAPHLKAGHLAVFDCAFKPAKGTRSIHYVGHIDMLSAVQPFISGAISKTVNMPENCTVEDIANVYIYAWEKKLKAVAIYRENSKRSQPLNTQKTEGEIVKKKEKAMTRERVPMPQTRKALTHKFDIAGHKGYLTVGLYDGGLPGEIFVVIHKEGSTIKGLMDAWARSVSLNLQYGAPVNDLFKKFRHQKFEPSGFIKNEEGGALDENLTQIKSASSIVDYVAQFMLNNFGEGSGGIKIEIGELQHIEEEQAELADFGNEGVTCPICGGPAKRIGNCAIVCTSCKQTTRSGCGE